MRALFARCDRCGNEVVEPFVIADDPTTGRQFETFPCRSYPPDWIILDYVQSGRIEHVCDGCATQADLAVVGLEPRTYVSDSLVDALDDAEAEA